MNVTRITTGDELEPLAADWNCLTRGVPFRSWQWLSPWWQHYGGGRQLYVLAVRDARGSLVGLAPWFIEGRGARGRAVRPLGSGEACSEYLSVLSTHEHEQAVVQAISQWLLAASVAGTAAQRDRWDLLELDGVAATDTAVSTLVASLEGGGCAVHRRQGMHCWRTDLPGTWEDFVSGLSKSQRKRIGRLERRVFACRRATLKTVRDEGELARGMEIFVELHQRRQQGLGQPGCFASRQFADFIRETSTPLFRSGSLRLAWLELDDRPVAAEFSLVGGQVQYLYQSGIDPNALRESPGHLITVALVKKAIAESVKAYDFLRGDEPYKAAWGARPCATMRIRVVPDRVAPRIRHRVWLAGVTLKHWVKSGLATTGII